MDKNVRVHTKLKMDLKQHGISVRVCNNQAAIRLDQTIAYSLKLLSMGETKHSQKMLYIDVLLE